MAQEAKTLSGVAAHAMFQASILFTALVVATLGCGSKHSTSQVSKIGTATSADDARNSNADTELLVFGQVPEFELMNQRSELFQSNSLDGHVYLVTFFFTTCPTTCPQQSREVARLQNVEGLRMVSITVQPEVDRPEVLEKYAEQFQADTSKWQFLTGTRGSIWELSQKGFMLAVGDAPQPGDLPIFHSSKIVLVDGQQQIRGFYESQSREEMAKLRKDASRLIEEATHAADETEEDLSSLQDSLQGAFNQE